MAAAQKVAKRQKEVGMIVYSTVVPRNEADFHGFHRSWTCGVVGATHSIEELPCPESPDFPAGTYVSSPAPLCSSASQGQALQSGTVLGAVQLGAWQGVAAFAGEKP